MSDDNKNAPDVPALITPERIEWARSLLLAMEADDPVATQLALDQLLVSCESPLFKEIGRLTRELHDAIVQFSRDTRIIDLAEDDMPDARERLRYVINLTDQAANRTLALVEETLPVAEKLTVRSEKLMERLAQLSSASQGNPQLVEVLDQLRPYLDSVRADGLKLRSNLTDVMMAQEFQDLTGQLLMRVTKVLEQVEEKLVGLIVISSSAFAVNKDVSAEAAKDAGAVARGQGPALPGKSDATVVKSQDEVDDLLASLGF